MLPAEGAELAQFDAVGGVLLVFLGGVIALLAIGASQDNVRASVLSCHCEHLFSECLYLMFPRRGCALAAGAC
ncbi:hypothetical protein SDC9_78791 [bioreactor metagenome]|uniref:Uncharacterized protein n=1 Tax=bioreactor metagenome TaxID=1076179 RepID=A0A644YV66_9ZZZZ